MTRQKTRDASKLRSKPKSPNTAVAGHGQLPAQARPLTAVQRALDAPPPSPLNTGDILTLQRTVGNRAVQHLLASHVRQHPNAPPIRPKLIVGPAQDAYEREADRVAAQIVTQRGRPQSPAPGSGDSLQREQTPEEDEPLRRAPLAGSIRRQEGAEEDEELKRKPSVQQQTTAAEGMAVPPDVESSILSERGGGQPLAENIRGSMENSFGADFGEVKVHTDSQAHVLNRSVQARAFTAGKDIFFGAGEYRPGSTEGQQLLAHELTHVVQQNAGAVQPRRDVIQRKEVGVTITTPTRARKMGTDPDSLFHGKAGRKLAKDEAATIYDNHTFRSRLKTDRREKGTRRNPVDAIWYKLKDDQDKDLYLRSGTFEPIDSAQAAAVLNDKMDDLTDWLPIGTFNGLVAGVKQDKMLRPHGQWLYEAIKVAYEKGAKKANLVEATRALFRYVRRAKNDPGDGPAFESEVLQASGWAEKQAQGETSAIKDALLLEVQDLYKRPKLNPNAPDNEPLDKAKLAQDLPPALINVLKAHDPAAFESVRQPIDRTMSGKANQIQKVAGAFFAYAARSTGTLKMIHGSWKYSKNIVDLQKEDVSGTRMALLLSRAQMSEVGVLDKVHYKSNRPDDLQALREVLQGMLTEKSTVELVDRHIRATPRRSAGDRVYMQTVLQKTGEGVDAQWNAQWQFIRSLSHEILHVMAHPKFNEAEDKVENAQIIGEGFVEVLGVDLYNHILAQARADHDFAQKITGGLAKPDIPADVPRTDLGYGDASQKAAQIRDRVGKQNFEAAFFLGVPDRVGIQ